MNSGRARVLVLSISVGLLAGCAATSNWVGNDRLKQGDHPGAIEALTRTIERDPSNFGAYLSRGVAHERLKEFDKALADYSRAIEIVPRFGRAYHNRGLVYAKLQKYDRAIADYDQALAHAHNPVIEAQGSTVGVDAAGVYYDRGNSLYQLKRYEEAIGSYGEAISRSPRFGAAYNNRGVCHSELGDKKAACADRTKACELGDQVACRWVQENCK
jgi:tetratricopeptide (TPR) repeat protein